MTGELREFSIPLARPLETADGTIDAREGILLRLDGDPGGIGEATPLAGWTEPHGACRTALADALDRLDSGEEAAALETLADRPAARHGLSLALADREARRAGRPLYRHLGGDGRVETVPVNATIGDGTVEETAAAARGAADDGFGCLKVKVGARPVADDVDRLAAVRDAVGPDVELRADANGAWSRAEAREALHAMGELGVAYVEQPLDPDDLDGHAALRGGPVGIALDETLASTSPAAVLGAGAADVLILKPMVVGGIDRARTIASRADDHGVETVVTTTVDAVVARTAAVHFAASLPDPPACGLATAGRLAADLGPDPAPVEEGTIRVPTADGHGVRIESE